MMENMLDIGAPNENKICHHYFMGYGQSPHMMGRVKIQMMKNMVHIMILQCKCHKLFQIK